MSTDHGKNSIINGRNLLGTIDIDRNTDRPSTHPKYAPNFNACSFLNMAVRGKKTLNE
jgi:hypothetical protein